MNSNEHLLDLTGWIDRIRGRDMPVFGRTIESLRRLLGDDRASASALAQVILKDAPMTTKVLRLANSAFFNHGQQGVHTVSRAIVVLGFDPVAEIALSVSLIDALLSGGIKGRAQGEMARSFHAAVQARWIAGKMGDSHGGEEVFIAALLARVGEMAFWCFGGEQARNLDRCLTQTGMREEEAQLVVLGFHLRQLSAGLVREWRLGSLLTAALEGGPRSRGSERAVILGHQIARAVEEGWESASVRLVMREIADHVEMPLTTVLAQVKANAAEAARIAATFGAREVARSIPQAAPLPDPELPGTIPPEVPATGPDPQLQLRILHDLAALTLAKANISDILQLVLEGLFRGVGCERVVVAVVSADRLSLLGKAALGAGGEALCARFQFSLDGEPEDLLDAAIDSGQGCWLTPARAELAGSERLQAVTGSDSAFLAPFGCGGRQVGVFYADRNGKALDEESWRAFQHFAMQTSLAVGMSSRNADSIPGL